MRWIDSFLVTVQTLVTPALSQDTTSTAVAQSQLDSLASYAYNITIASLNNSTLNCTLDSLQTRKEW